MIGTVSSSSQASQLIERSSGASQGVKAQLEAKIKAKEAEAKSAKDTTEAAKLAQELAALKAELKALEDAEKAAARQASQSARASDPIQQAGFDAQEPSSGKSIWI